MKIKNGVTAEIADSGRLRVLSDCKTGGQFQFECRRHNLSDAIDACRYLGIPIVHAKKLAVL